MTSELTVTEHHQGAPGQAHGGLLATAFDETMGFLLWVVGRPAVTARLETDYVLPVPVGSHAVPVLRGAGRAAAQGLRPRRRPDRRTRRADRGAVRRPVRHGP